MLPVRGQRDRAEMPTRGLASQVKLVGIAIEIRGVPVNPGDGAADLIGEHYETAADILHPGEIGHDIMRSGGDEHLGRSCEISRAAAAPSPAMNEDEDGCRGASGTIDVELLDLGCSVGRAFGFANPLARP